MSPILSARGGMSAGAYGWGALSAAGATYQSIATTSLSGVSGTTFSSIPGGFKHLQLRFIGLESSANDTRIRFNSDTGSNYARHQLYGQGSSAVSSGTASTTFIKASNAYNGMNATQPSVAIIDILDYASTTKRKTTRHFSGLDMNGSGDVSVMSGLWMNTSAITSVTFEINGSGSTFNAGSSIALYGIKESA